MIYSRLVTYKILILPDHQCRNLTLSQLLRIVFNIIVVMAKRRTRKASIKTDGGGVRKSQGISRAELKKHVSHSDVTNLKPSKKTGPGVVKSSRSHTTQSRVQPAVKSEDTEFLYSIAEEPTEPGVPISETPQRKQAKKRGDGSNQRVSSREMKWLEEETQRAQWRYKKQNEKDARQRESEPGYWLALAMDTPGSGYFTAW